jgi:uncharacterized protein (TIGR01244 family)
MHARSITPRLLIADQPTEAELAALPAQGCGGVVNLRLEGEPEQPLSAAAEGQLVQGLGMDYLHQPVQGGNFTAADVTAVSDFLDRHASTPVLVHCRKGGRAAALVLLHLAWTQGWPADEVFERGERLGLSVDGMLRVRVAQFLDELQNRA